MTFIRYLNQDDLNKFYSLRLLSFKESPFAFSESYEDEQIKIPDEYLNEVTSVGSPPEKFTLGAFEQKEMIGFVKFRRDHRSKGRHKAMIHAMYVHPDFRQKNVGTLLIENLKAKAKMLDGLEQIHLWVLHAQKSASNFYAKLGFVSQGIVRKDLKIGDRYIHAEYMVLDFLAEIND